jgi:hypothetical protein
MAYANLQQVHQPTMMSWHVTQANVCLNMSYIISFYDTCYGFARTLQEVDVRGLNALQCQDDSVVASHHVEAVRRMQHVSNTHIHSEQEAIKKAFPKHYLYDPTPVFKVGSCHVHHRYSSVGSENSIV